MRSVPALALAALAALASTAAALPPLPKPPVPGNPACLAHIATLRNGACSPIAKKVTKETALAITGATCAQLEALDITAAVSGRGGGGRGALPTGYKKKTRRAMAGNCRGRGVARPRALLPRPHTRTHHPFSLHPHLPVRPPPPAARTPSSLCRTCVEFFLEREREKEGETLAAEKCAEGQKKKGGTGCPTLPALGWHAAPQQPEWAGWQL